MKGFTDIHHHLIYGIDEDGPRTFEDTCAMLRAAQADGIHTIISTPHVIPGVQPFSLEEYFYKIDEARTYCKAQQINIEIYPGAEIFYTEMTTRFLNDRRVPTMNGTSHVLVEFPPDVRYEYLSDALWNLARNGYIPILAHAERYRCLVSHPRRAAYIKQQMDIRYQLNCSSILNGGGFFLGRFCRILLTEGLADAVASDAHNTATRTVAMTKAFKNLLDKYGRDYAESLTGYNGDQILHDALHEVRGAI